VATPYFQDNATSDLNLNSVLLAPTASKKLLQTAAGAATAVTITLDGSTNVQQFHWFISEPGDPGTTGGSGARSFTVHVNVTTASMNVAGSQLLVRRINSAGVAQNTWVALIGGTDWQTTGSKGATSAAQDLGTFAAGDRVAVGIVCSTTTGMNQSFVIEVGLSNGAEELATPWTFGAVERAGGLKQPRAVGQAVNRAATWMKRHSGIVVPRLWTPTGV
jgi:ribosomal protein L21E